MTKIFFFHETSFLQDVFIHLYAINRDHNFNNFTECHMHFVGFNERKEIDFFEENLLLPLNNFCNFYKLYNNAIS